MIVCVCNNINEKEVEKAVEDNCGSCFEVWNYYECRAQCGKCAQIIRKKVREKHLTLAE